MMKIKSLTLSLAATVALLMAIGGSGSALEQLVNPTNPGPNTAFCSCSGDIAPQCGSALITLGKNHVFLLTDVTVAGDPTTVTLEDGSTTKEGYSTGELRSTVSQAFQTPIIFTTNVTAVCVSTSASTYVTVNGVVH
jgi:hypothetical protein